ncbi:MAG: hypothetical protein WBW41_10185 [Verrucomicrobiia bacterium]
MREEEMNGSIFINTPLQRGARTGEERENRFNGFARGTETVETVPALLRTSHTPLKQGVNEKTGSQEAK